LELPTSACVHPQRPNKTNDQNLKKLWLDLAQEFYEVADRLERQGA
jgi:hypothetical protein